MASGLPARCRSRDTPAAATAPPLLLRGAAAKDYRGSVAQVVPALVTASMYVRNVVRTSFTKASMRARSTAE